jgi:hypothetical protein
MAHAGANCSHVGIRINQILARETQNFLLSMAHDEFPESDIHGFPLASGTG